jgi:hypothetical protein
LVIFFSISPYSGDEAVLQTQPFVQPELIAEEKKKLFKKQKAESKKLNAVAVTQRDP